jgi:hypothetical protein
VLKHRYVVGLGGGGDRQECRVQTSISTVARSRPHELLHGRE